MAIECHTRIAIMKNMQALKFLKSEYKSLNKIISWARKKQGF